MDFMKFFKSQTEETEKYGRLFDKLKKVYTDTSEDNLLKLSCIAGLFARVAYVDLHLDKNEIKKMKELLSDWSRLDELETDKIIDMAIENVKEMADLENHIYTRVLSSVLNEDIKYKIIQSLFLIAASDGEVASIESEEIRLICKGLILTNQHYIAARAEVLEYLKVLN